MSETYDVIVIGLGAMGSATAYQLAKRGAKVLGIDQFIPPHTFGSSHGDTRVTRLACGEGAEYTALARRSNEIWRELEQTTGKSLLVQNGLLVVSGPGKRAEAHENPDFLQTTISIAQQHNIAHEVLSDQDIRARFPAFAVADGDKGYFEPSGGILFPETCIAIELTEARRFGATLNTDETVLSFSSSDTGVSVTTTRASYSAAKLVISAGAWLPKLLPQDLAALFTVRRQVLAWFRVADRALEHYRPEAFPVFYWQLPRPQTLYGFPWIGGGEPALKIATEHYDSETNPDNIDRSVSDEEIRAMHESYVADFFPGVSGDCVKSAVCMYTCTDNARFVIDKLPDEDNVIVASPCSGHGFKHSAAIGESLAKLATEESAPELQPFAWPAPM